MKQQHSLDHHFIRNTVSISGAELCWGLALPVVVESTFLQLYLRSIGASETMIGLIPAIMAAGLAFFSPVSALLTSHLQHKRRAVTLAHIASSMPWIVYGLILIFADSNPGPGVFLLFYALFAALLGITVPVWQTFLVKIFSPKKTLPALSVMMITQIAARMISGLLIAGAVQKLSFSQKGSAAVFAVSGIFFFIGSLSFIISHEHAQTAVSARENKHTPRTLFHAGKQILKNRNFIMFQLSTVEVNAAITVISFYATYAVEFHGVSGAVAAGMFAVCIYAGGIFANIAFGSFNLLSLKKKLFVSKISSIAGIAVLMCSHAAQGFLAASVLIGVSRGITQLSYSPAVKKLSRLNDATDYFSAAPLLMLPFAFGIPALSGFAITHSGLHKEAAYLGVFGTMALLTAAGMLLLRHADFDAL